MICTFLRNIFCYEDILNLPYTGIKRFWKSDVLIWCAVRYMWVLVKRDFFSLFLRVRGSVACVYPGWAPLQIVMQPHRNVLFFWVSWACLSAAEQHNGVCNICSPGAHLRLWGWRAQLGCIHSKTGSIKTRWSMLLSMGFWRAGLKSTTKAKQIV